MKVGLIAAMSEEVKPLVGRLGLAQVSLAPFGVFEGRCGSNSVLLAQSGPGKINASAAAQYLVSRHEVDLLAGTGAAGAIAEGIRAGDIVVARDVLQFDSGMLAPGDFVALHTSFYAGGQMQFLRRIPCASWAVEKCNGLAESFCAAGPAPTKGNGGAQPRAVCGTIVTGDQIVSSFEVKTYLRQAYEALAVDMESAAIGQVAELNDLPFFVVRAVSDQADSSVAIDFSKFIDYRGEPRNFATRLKKAGSAGLTLVSNPSMLAKGLQLRRGMDLASATAAEFLSGLLAVL
jgi:adenosylhomocysteine nucleosidase